MESRVSTLPNPQILGTLKEPFVQPLLGGNGISATYHWETKDQRHTFLHLIISKRPDKRFGIARTNIDSEEVKGQGDALWTFLRKKIQEYSNRGLTGNDPFPIIHEVRANKHSVRLPSSDSRYIQSDDRMTFYGLYLPEAP